jgi:hypothetical protein|tara:strand:- start:244 stop:465 length:222 start_codon:yes stop_codon:yes gene_type:complete
MGVSPSGPKSFDLLDGFCPFHPMTGGETWSLIHLHLLQGVLSLQVQEGGVDAMVCQVIANQQFLPLRIGAEVS